MSFSSIPFPPPTHTYDMYINQPSHALRGGGSGGRSPPGKKQKIKIKSIFIIIEIGIKINININNKL